MGTRLLSPRPPRRPPVASALAWGTLCWAALVPSWAFGLMAEPILAVESDRDGVAAHAVLELPVPPDALRAVLTDYERWPELFANRFRLRRIERRPDAVITELLIERRPLPGELRLVCATWIRPDGAVVTTGMGGDDFRRYERRWRLEAIEGGTRAVMDMRLALLSWVPRWLLLEYTRADLEEHFRILERRAEAQGRRP